MAGATDDEIQALSDYCSSHFFREVEKLAFELADAGTQVPAEIPDNLFAHLAQHYSVPEMVELATIIALENFRSRVDGVFRVEANGLYCLLPSGKMGAGARRDGDEQPS